MKIKINDDGYLEIERAGKFKEQYCPSGGKCGDGCALFEELEKEDDCIILRLCKKVYLIKQKDFTDERVQI